MSDSDSTADRDETGVAPNGRLPVLPLRDVVVYPHMVIPLFVGREKSIDALDSAMSVDKRIMLAAQTSAAVDEPGADDIHRVGTVATILQLLKLPDGTIKVLVEGQQRAHIENVTTAGSGYFVADWSVPEAGAAGGSPPKEDKEVEVLVRSVTNMFDQYVKMNKKVPPEILSSLTGVEDADRLADMIAAQMSLRVEEKQNILELFDSAERLEHLLNLMESELDMLQVEKRIRGRVKQQMEKSQREYYLNEQMKAIQKELGEMDDVPNETEELARKIEKAGMSKEAHKKASAEFNKLKSMSPMSAEATVVRNYVDTLVSLPWKKKSKLKKTLAEAEADPRERSLRAREGQGAHPRVPRRAEARRPRQGADPLSRRPARRRQDLAREVDRAGDGPSLQPHGARRRARRGRDPRSPPHLHRLHARQDRAEPRQGEAQEPADPARRDRQDVDGLPRGPLLGAARGARSGAEPHLHRSLSRGRVRPLRRHVRGHGQHDEHPRARCSIGWRSSASRVTPRWRRPTSPSATFCRGR